MKVSYKKLWHRLIDEDMRKVDLREATGMSSATMAKITNNEEVTLSTITRICEVLNCDVGDVVEVIHESNATGESKKSRLK